ncbi:hypothetical protein BN2476_830031 [Paraburkholderia piptadeniae]|uniref:Uncharacterized protein n=1 Tax=Paraburkholderia piptadeniae TaxID=1701573 RepID=A0A1N7SSZ7_9BURK|nr:hypothetical protein BN2476_830031 [Paraburkholderia piptadeniae]
MAIVLEGTLVINGIEFKGVSLEWGQRTPSEDIQRWSEEIMIRPEPITIPLTITPEEEANVRRFMDELDRLAGWHAPPTRERTRRRRAQWKDEQSRYGRKR